MVSDADILEELDSFIDMPLLFFSVGCPAVQGASPAAGRSLDVWFRFIAKCQVPVASRLSEPSG